MDKKYSLFFLDMIYDYQLHAHKLIRWPLCCIRRNFNMPQKMRPLLCAVKKQTQKGVKPNLCVSSFANCCNALQIEFEMEKRSDVLEVLSSLTLPRPIVVHGRVACMAVSSDRAVIAPPTADAGAGAGGVEAAAVNVDVQQQARQLAGTG